ncbi:acyltransferase family protein [Lacrimispora saccharolytica]|nr:acyltransferase family protein [Lacrimispora saccharolytica]
MGDNSRINWIDTAKGIGIVLVVIGHTRFFPKAIIDMIFTFHMPLFFFLSGYVFREKSNFYVAQIKQLLLKYVILSFAFSTSYCYLSGGGGTRIMLNP